MSWERWRTLPQTAKSNWLVTFFYLQKGSANRRGISLSEQILSLKGS